jgi:hypothetical protein
MDAPQRGWKPAWKPYRKAGITEMRRYVPGEDLTGVSVNKRDYDEGLVGGMIARDPENPGDRWFVANEYFVNNYVEA